MSDGDELSSSTVKLGDVVHAILNRIPSKSLPALASFLTEKPAGPPRDLLTAEALTVRIDSLLHRRVFATPEIKSDLAEFLLREPMTSPSLNLKIWLLSSGALASSDRQRGLYSSLTRGDRIDSRAIRADVSRTAVRGGANGRAALSRVLTAAAARDAEEGYCQGMNVIVAFLLDCGVGEEEAFWILVHLQDEVFGQGYFADLLPLAADLRLVSLMIRENQPGLFAKMRTLGADPAPMFASHLLLIFTGVKNAFVGSAAASFRIRTGTDAWPSRHLRAAFGTAEDG